MACWISFTMAFLICLLPFVIVVGIQMLSCALCVLQCHSWLHAIYLSAVMNWHKVGLLFMECSFGVFILLICHILLFSSVLWLINVEFVSLISYFGGYTPVSKV